MADRYSEGEGIINYGYGAVGGIFTITGAGLANRGVFLVSGSNLLVDQATADRSTELGIGIITASASDGDPVSLYMHGLVKVTVTGIQGEVTVGVPLTITGTTGQLARITGVSQTPSGALKECVGFALQSALDDEVLAWIIK